MMQKGSATLAVIASTTTLALTSLGYHIPILAGEAKADSFSVYGGIALVILVFAVLVYRIHDEIPRKIREITTFNVEMDVEDTLLDTTITHSPKGIVEDGTEMVQLTTREFRERGAKKDHEH